MRRKAKKRTTLIGRREKSADIVRKHVKFREEDIWAEKREIISTHAVPLLQVAQHLRCPSAKNCSP